MRGWNMWLKRKFSGLERQALGDCRQGDAAYGSQNYGQALGLYEESLKKYRQIERWDRVLLLRLQLGDVALLARNFAAARTHLEQAVSLARNQKNMDCLESALSRLATVAALQGEIALAERLCKECLQMERAPEKALDYVVIQSVLGSISKTNADAIAHFECALEICREKEVQAAIVSCLCSLGHCTAPGEDYTLPRGWLQECLELCEAIRNEKLRSYALNNLGNIERFEGNLDSAMDLYRESLRIKQDLGDEWAIAYTLDGCAAIAATQGRGEKAAKLLGKSSEIRKRMGTPLEGRKLPEYHATVAQVRELLTAEEFELAWEAGQRFSMPEAVLEAT